MQRPSPKSRSDKTAHIIKYIDTDLLCYRAEKPEALAKLQEESWQPWIDWFEKTYKTKSLKTTNGISALKQEDTSKLAVQEEIVSYSEKKFEALYGAVTLCGSLVLGLAIIDNKLSPEDAVKLIFLEEYYKEKVYNAEKHGVDPLIEAKRIDALNNLNHALTLARESAKNANASKA